MMILVAVLLYFLIGVILLLSYLLAFRPEKNDVQIGLIVLFWPVVLLVDFVFALGAQFGALSRKLVFRFRK